LVIEGVILGLFSASDLSNQTPRPNLIKLRNDIETYRINIIDTKSILTRSYNAVFEVECYDPEKIKGESITGIYNKLHDQRKLIVDELVRDFLP